jgi:hypothetical protein
MELKKLSMFSSNIYLGRWWTESRQRVGLLCAVTILGSRMQQCCTKDADAVQQSRRDEATPQVTYERLVYSCVRTMTAVVMTCPNPLSSSPPSSICSEMTGVEFALVHDRFPTLFVIQKQRRRSPQEGIGQKPAHAHSTACGTLQTRLAPKQGESRIDPWFVPLFGTPLLVSS